MISYEIETVTTATIMDEHANKVVTIEKYVSPPDSETESEEQITFHMEENSFSIKEARMLAEALNKLLEG